MTTARSEKKDRQFWHRDYRRAEKIAIHKNADVMPHSKEMSDTWAMDKDGKQWFDPKRWPKGMRK